MNGTSTISIGYLNQEDEWSVKFLHQMYPYRECARRGTCEGDKRGKTWRSIVVVCSTYFPDEQLANRFACWERKDQQLIFTLCLPYFEEHFFLYLLPIVVDKVVHPLLYEFQLHRMQWAKDKWNGLVCLYHVRIFAGVFDILLSFNQ